MSKSSMTAAEFRTLSTGEQLEHLLNRSLEDCKTILDFDVNDPRISYGSRNMMVNAKLAVIRCVLDTATKAGERTGRLNAQRDQVFGEMAEEYRRLKSIDGGKK